MSVPGGAEGTALPHNGCQWHRRWHHSLLCVLCGRRRSSSSHLLPLRAAAPALAAATAAAFSVVPVFLRMRDAGGERSRFVRDETACPDGPVLRDAAARCRSERLAALKVWRTKRDSSTGTLPDPPPPPLTPSHTRLRPLAAQPCCGAAPPFCFSLRAREPRRRWLASAPLCLLPSAFDSPVGIRSAAGTLGSFLTAAEWRLPPFVLPQPHQTNKHAVHTKKPANGSSGVKRRRSATPGGGVAGAGTSSGFHAKR